MKNTIKILILSLICLLGSDLKAQDGYTLTLVHNGSYSFTVQAVPNTSTNNFGTIVQGYGFTLIVPDGVTITVNSSLGNSASQNAFDASGVPGGEAGTDGYLITETLASPATLPAPSAATNSNLVTFTVNGAPTTGIIKIAPNNSAIMTTNPTIGNSLKAFMQADMIDNGMTEFDNTIEENGAAVSGNSSFDFMTLSVEEENELLSLSLYPNPANDIVKIIVPNEIKDIAIEVFDNTGKQIAMTLAVDNTIDVSNLASGLYLINIISNDIKTTKKLIVK